MNYKIEHTLYIYFITNYFYFSSPPTTTRSAHSLEPAPPPSAPEQRPSRGMLSRLSDISHKYLLKGETGANGNEVEEDEGVVEEVGVVVEPHTNHIAEMIEVTY